MYSRPLAYDPVTGIRRDFHVDTDEKTVFEEITHDVEPILDANKAAQNAAGSNFRGEFVRVASIPVALYHDLVRQGIAQDNDRFTKWLNDPDNRHFRTTLGRV